MEKVIETISALVGKPVSEETEIISLMQDTKMGVGDILNYVCERLGGRISNKVAPKKVGEINIKFFS